MRLRKRLGHLVIALVAAALYLAGALEPIENALTDLRFRLLTRPAAGDLVVVRIDPESLRTLDVWPWPRGYHATVLENLIEAGAERVAFDIDFSSRSDPEEDAALASALAASGGRAILPVFHQRQADGGLTLTSPMPAFARHAALASINIIPETNGLVRRYRSTDPGGTGLPSLAIALAGEASPEPGTFWIDYGIDVETIPQLSYVDALTGRSDAGGVRGKRVIVGSTAVELGDQVAVPVHTTLAGPLLQALAYDAIATGRILRGASPALCAALVVLLGGLAGSAVASASWRRGLLVVTSASLGFFAAAMAAQTSLGTLVDISPLILTMAGSYGLGLVERIDRQRVRIVLESVRARRSETMMRHVVENSFEAIVTIDDSGNVETFNAAAEALFRCSAADALGRPAGDLLHGLGDEGLAPGQARREALARRRDGSNCLVEVTLSRFNLGGRELRVGFIRDITERKRQQRALEHQATHDALTDLPNRVMLQSRMAGAISSARRGGRPFAFMILDLDRFKEVNDTLGHQVGDVLLKEIAVRLVRPLGPDDTIARLGGDEFAVIIPGADRERAGVMAERLIGTLREPFRLQDLTLMVDTSIGIAMYPEHGTEASLLVQRADVAMYVSKKVRNTVSFYDPVADFNSVRHLTLKGQLGQAVDEGLLVLHYQPKISTNTGRVEGVEALVRWSHPQLGLVSPIEFIPLAEYTGLIKPITHWVLETALRQCAAWRSRGLDLPISVNCSARNLLEEDLPGAIGDRLRAFDLPADRLTLEITETAIIEDPRRALDVVTELAALGVRISIDDFGTGYSSLNYLKRLPADEIKIDKSFVMGMASHEDDAVIVRSTVDLAHNLGLRAVAEGVDSKEVFDRLARLGCDSAQGYYFSRPLPAEALVEWCDASPWGLQRAGQAAADGS